MRRRSLNVRIRFVALATVVATLSSAFHASATPALVMDVASGDVLYQDQATQPWYPASLTKLMTVYVALNAVRAHRIALDTPLVVSVRAASMPPSKMGFVPGTQVTLDNALKMLMVRSANDLAITVAEGVSGSVEAFAEDMNQAAAEIGLRESHFVNPNGLPDPNHVSSARDMALIARALYLKFPEESGLFNLGALALGSEIITNHNNLLGRYPGVDGMKTGFTCSAGFNVVASAYKDGRRYVTVIMGAPSVAARSAKAAALFDRAFAGIDRPTSSIVALPSRNPGEAPPDMRNEVCRNRAKLIARFNSEVEQLDAPLITPTAASLTDGATNGRAFLLSAPLAPTRPTAMATIINAIPAPSFDPVAVHIGADPGYAGVVAQARPPHSEIGTPPDPATAMIAYAPSAEPAVVSPLGVDAHALPMKGRRLAAKRLKGRILKASAEAPVTKVIDDKPAPAKKPASKHAKQASDEPVGDTGETTKPLKTKTAMVVPPKRPAPPPKVVARTVAKIAVKPKVPEKPQDKPRAKAPAKETE